MTDAIELGPIEPEGVYGFAISKWNYRKNDDGIALVDTAFDVIKPEGKPGKVFDTIQLENEYTKARAKKILAVTGLRKEEDMEKSKKLKMPAPGEMLGQQFGARIKTVRQVDYPDKSVFVTLFPMSELDAMLSVKT